MARERLSEYLEAVGAQIRWRRARRPLLRELSDHIADQAAAFEAEGQSPGEALAAAVAEMGEPEEVGRALDRLHRPRSCWRLALTVAVLLGAGLVLQLLAYQITGDGLSAYYFRRQAVGLALAAGVLVCLWFADYTLLFRRRWISVAAMAVLCLSFLLIPSAWLRNWWTLPVYYLLVYPVLLLPVPYAALLITLRGKGLLAVLLCGITALALPSVTLLLPNLTAWLVSAACMLTILLSAVRLGWFRGKRRWNILAALGPALAGIPALWFRLAADGRTPERLAAFWNPALDPFGYGWWYARLRAWEVPYHTPDLLLAEVSQGLGRWVFWAAAAGILLLAALLLRRVFSLRSRTGRLVALAALCPLLLQAAIYWLYNLGWWPLGVLSLPFLSYGVTFLLVDAALAGVLLSVFRMDALVRDAAAGDRQPIPLPGALTIPLGRGALYIQYRKKA